ncbi:hypothetical protein AB0F64_37500 [Streptomyces sp. NPDC026294]|uniref:hypothetical protein n=1 Tax=Streptomyces sp. NPDC026294 TaxID=3155362 RepID=UPI00341017BF
MPIPVIVIVALTIVWAAAALITAFRVGRNGPRWLCWPAYGWGAYALLNPASWRRRSPTPRSR